MLLSATPLIFGGAALATGDLGASLAIVAVAFQWYLKALALMVLLVAALIAAYVLLMSLHSLAENWKKVVVGAAAVLVGIPAATFLVAALATRDLQRSVDLVVATNLRLAAVVAFPLGIVLAILLVWAVWAKWSG
jgi:hypothetical protein